MRRFVASCLLLLAVAADARADDAAADRADASVDGGAAVGTPGVDDDPWERGASALPNLRPILPLRACSLRGTACVHGAHGTEHELTSALARFDASVARVTGALHLPAPDVDPSTGAFDVYLVDSDDEDARVRFGGRDVLASYDRASAFVELPRGLRGCDRDVAIERAVVRASLMRASPSATRGVLAAASAHLARLTVPCDATSELDEVAAFQREPTRSWFDAGDAAPADMRFVRGASAFFDWTDARFSAEPGGLVRASFALMATRTPLGSETFTYRPDLFEVWRTSFKEALSIGSSIDDLFLRFTGARAAMGSRADATTLLASKRWGDAADVRVDLSVDWPERARRFLSPKPVAPTGASFIAVRRAGAKPGARLRIEAEWEEHARFKLMALKRDANGRVTNTVLVPSTTRATSAQATVTELDGVDTVLVVAMNAGDHDRPFDPDEPAYEPHAFLLTLASE